jgi:hypothetical protein
MDILQVKIIDNSFFQTKSKKGSIIPIQKDLILSKYIPRQISKNHVPIMTTAS